MSYARAAELWIACHATNGSHPSTQEMNTMNEASVDPDRQRGLYRKYELYRVDETDPTQRSLVFDPFFVLRYTRDPHARVALAAYATSCAHDYPQLAAELREALRKSDGAQPDDDPCPDDWDTDED